MSKTKQTPGAMRRTNRFFVQVKGYGHCDDKGRTVMGIELSTGKLIATPDKPLMSLIAPLLGEFMKCIDYSSPEAAAKDVAAFKNSISKRMKAGAS